VFADYIRSIAPDTVQVKVTPMHGGQGYVCPISLPAYQAAEKGFEKAFGKKPLAVRRGGSIPIISTFEQVLGIKTVLMGFGLESNAIHSPNENFPLDIFRKGIEAVVEFHIACNSVACNSLIRRPQHLELCTTVNRITNLLLFRWEIFL